MVVDEGESSSILLFDDDDRWDEDDELDEDGPAPFMSSHTVKPQLCGSMFSILCRATSPAVSTVLIEPADTSGSSLRFPFATVLNAPSSRTFFDTTSSPFLLGADSAMTAPVTGDGTGDSLPVEVLARGLLYLALESSSVSRVLFVDVRDERGGEGCNDPTSILIPLGVVSVLGAVKSRRAGDRPGVNEGSARADRGTAGGGINSRSRSCRLPRLLIVRPSSSSSSRSIPAASPPSASSSIIRLAVRRSSAGVPDVDDRGFSGEEARPW